MSIKFLLLVLFILLSALPFSKQSYGVSLSVPKSDAVLLVQIKTQITADQALAKLPIDITLSHGAVGISGVVPTAAEANALIILVASTAGVRSVDVSGLTLSKGGTLASDDVINSQVIGSFNKEGLMGPLSKQPITITVAGPGNGSSSITPPPINIQVQTQNAVVYLSGTVPNQATADKALSLAKLIPGVSAVQSMLKVVSHQ